MARMQRVEQTTTVDIQREDNDSVRITVHRDGDQHVFTVPNEPLVETRSPQSQPV